MKENVRKRLIMPTTILLVAAVWQAAVATHEDNCRTLIILAQRHFYKLLKPYWSASKLFKKKH